MAKLLIVDDDPGIEVADQAMLEAKRAGRNRVLQAKGLLDHSSE